ncbi:MAG: hypothetical protein H6822_27195 [Planctomycetaceae bacterium]|nr:hypothetical protein [Planctomycetales bacterium]MCB9925865.1 hypothetical protein [Planctomycetaceae bacterium]
MPLSLRYLIASCVILLLAACNSSAPQTPEPVADDHSVHGHAHSHNHEEAGPNGGHLVELGDEEYHIEWTHDDATGLVTLYVLDSTAKELVPITSESLTITAKVQDAIEYKLAAVEPSGNPPASAQFALKSPELLVSLQLAGQGTDVSVAVTVDGKDYKGEFEHHEHGHHH